jgi:hypothetical protein
VESYILRFYRRSPEEGVCGLIETADGAPTRAFANASELFAILSDLTAHQPVSPVSSGKRWNRDGGQGGLQ